MEAFASLPSVPSSAVPPHVRTPRGWYTSHGGRNYPPLHTTHPQCAPLGPEITAASFAADAAAAWASAKALAAASLDDAGDATLLPPRPRIVPPLVRVRRFVADELRKGTAVSTVERRGSRKASGAATTAGGGNEDDAPAGGGAAATPPPLAGKTTKEAEPSSHSDVNEHWATVADTLAADITTQFRDCRKDLATAKVSLDNVPLASIFQQCLSQKRSLGPRAQVPVGSLERFQTPPPRTGGLLPARSQSTQRETASQAQQQTTRRSSSAATGGARAAASPVPTSNSLPASPTAPTFNLSSTACQLRIDVYQRTAAHRLRTAATTNLSSRWLVDSRSNIGAFLARLRCPATENMPYPSTPNQLMYLCGHFYVNAPPPPPAQQKATSSLASAAADANATSVEPQHNRRPSYVDYSLPIREWSVLLPRRYLRSETSQSSHAEKAVEVTAGGGGAAAVAPSPAAARRGAKKGHRPEPPAATTSAGSHTIDGGDESDSNDDDDVDGTEAGKAAATSDVVMWAPWRDCPVHHIEVTRWSHVPFRLYECGVWRHQGQCDHTFAVVGCTPLTGNPPVRGPVCLSAAPLPPTLCHLCCALPATVLSYADMLAPVHPAALCQPCMTLLHPPKEPKAHGGGGDADGDRPAEADEEEETYLRYDLPPGKYF